MVEPWVTPGLDEARPSFGIAAAVTPLVSAFCGVGQAAGRNKTGLGAAKDVLSQPQRVTKTPPDGKTDRVSYSQDEEVGRQPLDPARQSFCDADNYQVAAR